MPDLDLIKQEEQGPWDAALESKADGVAAKVRAEGGVPDARVSGDTEGAVQWLRKQSSFNGNTLMGGISSGAFMPPAGVGMAGNAK